MSDPDRPPYLPTVPREALDLLARALDALGPEFSGYRAATLSATDPRTGMTVTTSYSLDEHVARVHPMSPWCPRCRTGAQVLDTIAEALESPPTQPDGIALPVLGAEPGTDAYREAGEDPSGAERWYG